jgi:translation initiation factor 1 (eIF-1/SUI1)
MYRVYSGPPGTEKLGPLEKQRCLFKEFSLLDEAMGFAHHLKEKGHVAVLIEGDDGTRFDRKELARALHRRSNEQTHGAW